MGDLADRAQKKLKQDKSNKVKFYLNSTKLKQRFHHFPYRGVPDTNNVCIIKQIKTTGNRERQNRRKYT